MKLIEILSKKSVHNWLAQLELMLKKRGFEYVIDWRWYIWFKKLEDEEVKIEIKNKQELLGDKKVQNRLEALNDSLNKLGYELKFQRLWKEPYFIIKKLWK